ncbi:two-component sensor histidine kinase [Longispora fulva]|uniref:Sensor histidine kinase MtrB n=1 Tax=Longispora fulva TaxID=619741 RepID=A0A8J7KZ78_9ACTN|nr:MtrAB system histidine kinase MtrB [Longispora fulva]MBG6140402.1 two-component system sensor histidine kinase MtrB [Longispora fulva]GIG57217.1 two-component sensor histidine kinase [Longispora fulva]
MRLLSVLYDRGAARLVRVWRRSLHFRVVSVTLVSSTLLVVTFSWLLASQITASQVGSKLNEAQNQLEQGRVYLEPQFRDRGEAADPGVNGFLRYATALLVPPTSTAPKDAAQNDKAASVPYYVLLEPTNPDFLKAVKPQSPQLEDTRAVQKAVPDDLRRTVKETRKSAYQYVRANPDSQGERPFIVVGTMVNTAMGEFSLYYLYPLDEQVSSASSVRTTVFVTGLALVLLLALLSALITHLVVGPVRIAARTAQRLSAGLLDQRMEVRGEDDLAALATSFNQMAANLQRQINRLEEMSRLQRRFTSDVSHELRTPLTTVRMAADMLFANREDFDPLAARSAELLQAELDRFEDLLTDLLEISRYDAGFAVLDTEAVDLVPIVTRVVERLRPLADRAQVELRTVVPDEPVIAEVDPRRIERVLRNLVGNAVEHGEARPVVVTLADGEGSAAVTVRDHGIGLNTGEDKLVFNRFWRADPSRARQTGGTGLGLSISLEDARLHGGWLEAWGAPGLGAQFRLTVPLRAGDRLLSSPLPLVPADAEPQLGPIPPDEPTRGVRHAS